MSEKRNLRRRTAVCLC